ncbi:MAG: N-acetyltransferase family protein [Pseudomonadota bacterium]
MGLWVEARRAAGFPVLVAENAAPAPTTSVALGYASFGPFRPHAAYARTVEHSVYVSSSVRRRGVGQALLKALITRAKAAGAHAMIGGLEAGNIASVALHESHGFEEVGRLPEVGRKFDRWLTLVLMQRRL